VPRFNPFLRRLTGVICWTVYAVAVGFFLWTTAHFYVPGKGFTYLIQFGDEPARHHVRELQSAEWYVHRGSFGYDGQHYAQLAVKPRLSDPDLGAAMDNLPYRARRILFCWTAYGLGLGQPQWVLEAYALQNVAAWLLLAGLLLRWFPPTGAGNVLRWLGTLFASGMVLSVHEALPDGPSLLLIAGGVALAELGRPWLSAGLLGVAGLGRETNLIAGLIHLPGREWSRREIWRAAGRGALVAAPLTAWMVWIWLVVRGPGGAGQENFLPPLVGCVHKWAETLRELRADGWHSHARWSLLLLLSLTVQFFTLALRPQWRSLWWRVGAGYAVLLVFLGDGVWEGTPGAVARVVLPLTLAFNVVVPPGRWWTVGLLGLGNLTVLNAATQIVTPGSEGYRLEGASNPDGDASGQPLTVTFDAQWYEGERSTFEYWRWSRGPAEIVIGNRTAAPMAVELEFDLRAVDARTVRVFQERTLRWEGRVGREGGAVHLLRITLPPGDSRWSFATDAPPVVPNPSTLRAVAFNLRNFVIRRVRDGP
jgi:hypothetical protein